MRAAETAEVRGLAWDGGYGIRRVEFSVDGGQVWREAELGKDVGRFAFRAFRFAFTPPRAGDLSGDGASEQRRRPDPG